MTLSPFLSPSAADTLYAPKTLPKALGVIAGLLRTPRRALQARSFDVIFVAREASLVGPPILERLASIGRPLVFDFDDAIWLPQEGSANSRWSWLRFPEKTRELCRMATSVTAGNDYLADWARRWNSNVTVIPSTVDLDVYGPPKVHGEPGRTVGWIGSHSTVRYLEAILPALSDAAKEHPFRLLVVGAKITPPQGLEVECRPWRADRESDDIREMDVGLMPLPDNEWTRGKCALKAIQYMALGVPPVVSPVGASLALVREHETGRFARHPAEWTSTILDLLSDPSLRCRIGARARIRVASAFSPSAVPIASAFVACRE